VNDLMCLKEIERGKLPSFWSARETNDLEVVLVEGFVMSGDLTGDQGRFSTYGGE